MTSPILSSASLTFVGVGPGDPSLLTLAAVQAIESATVVSYPVAYREAEGMAAQIASAWISESQHRLPLLFPMVLDGVSLKKAWSEASDQLAAAVANGEKVVFLCQGDVSLFATSSYLLLALKANHPDCLVKMIPGVTAFTAAAAEGAWPLCLQKDQLLVLPTPENAKSLEILLDESAASNRVLVLLKLGHRWSWVRPLLQKRGLLKQALFAQKVGWPDQNVAPASQVSESAKPYFSLLLVRQGWPDLVP